jgi:uncharacterized membrane protein
MKKPIGQRIAFVVAILCYVAAAACVVGVFLYQTTETNDPIRSSLMASVVFFVGCGVVLHVIATTRLKGILSGSGDFDRD